MTSLELFDQFVAACAQINASISLERTQQDIVDQAMALFQARGASLMLRDLNDGALIISASRGLSEAYLTKGPVIPERSLGETIRRIPIIVTDVATDPQVQYREEALREGIRGIVGLPMAVGRILVGSLRLYFSTPRSFTTLEIKAMQALAQQAGLALKKNAYHAALIELNSAIHQIQSLYSFKSTMHKLVAIAARSAYSRGCALWLLNRESMVLESLSSYGLSQNYLEKGPITADRSLGEVMNGHPVVISSVANDPRVQYPAQAAVENIKAIVGFPVTVGHKTVGALRFYFSFEFEPDRDDLVWMGHLADQVGLALSRSKLIIELKDGHDRYQDLIENPDLPDHR